MKRQKIRENRPEGQPKATAEKWKNKSREKSLVIKDLRKRNSELTKSRDNWKIKYQSVRNLSLNKGTFDGHKAKQHQYALSVVM